MKFAIALDAMKAGAKVKRPTWAGYWEWDPEAETIRMHCRPEESDNGNPVLDIRETQRVEYTLRNILADDWMYADEGNTPLLAASRKGCPLVTPSIWRSVTASGSGAGDGTARISSSNLPPAYPTKTQKGTASMSSMTRSATLHSLSSEHPVCRWVGSLRRPICLQPIGKLLNNRR